MAQIFLSTGTSYNTPGDWQDTGHTVELYGAGGNGGAASTGVSYRPGAGGGGGGYIKLTYSSGSTGTAFTYSIGAANTATGVRTNTTWQSTTTTNSWYATSGLAGGAGGTSTTGGTGGGSGSIGTPSPVTYTNTFSALGGNGGNTAATTCSGGGGGGGAGPNGAGGNGGTSTVSGYGGGGGGGANGGGNGTNASNANGGNGGNGRSASGSGSGGTSTTTNGSGGTISTGAGGGGGYFTASAANSVFGGDGAGDEVYYVGSEGPGGGGGGGGSCSQNTAGANTLGGWGALYGGGGGGAGGTRNATSTRDAGQGSQGLIVITYTPVSTLYWVSGTGLWDALPSKWATSSGGTASTYSYPTTSVNAIFDSNSDSSANLTVTIGSSAACRDLIFVNPDRVITLAGSTSNSVTISGNIRLPSSNLTPSFNGIILITGASNITCNNNILSSNITVNAMSNTVRLIDNLTTSSGALYHQAGTINLSGKVLSLRRYQQHPNPDISTIDALTSGGKITLTSNFSEYVWYADSAGILNISGYCPIEITGGNNSIKQIYHVDSEFSRPVFNLNCTSGRVEFDNGTSVSTINLNGNLTLANRVLTVYNGYTYTSGTIEGGSNAWSFFGSTTFDSKGVLHDFPLALADPFSSLTLQSNLYIGPNKTLTIAGGTFNANNKDLNVGNVSIDGSVVTDVTMGSGQWTLSGTGNVWNASGDFLTLNRNGSNINISNSSTASRTFSGGGLTYGNLTIAGSGTSNLDIYGSNSFNVIASTKTVAHTVRFAAGSTTTLNDWRISGSSGNMVTITSSTNATHTLSKSSGNVNADYLTISYSTATGGAIWRAGGNSINAGNTLGWNFSGPNVPGQSSSGNMMFLFM